MDFKNYHLREKPWKIHGDSLYGAAYTAQCNSHFKSYLGKNNNRKQTHKSPNRVRTSENNLSGCKPYLKFSPVKWSSSAEGSRCTAGTEEQLCTSPGIVFASKSPPRAEVRGSNTAHWLAAARWTATSKQQVWFINEEWLKIKWKIFLCKTNPMGKECHVCAVSTQAAFVKLLLKLIDISSHF